MIFVTRAFEVGNESRIEFRKLAVDGAVSDPIYTFIGSRTYPPRVDTDVLGRGENVFCVMIVEWASDLSLPNLICSQGDAETTWVFNQGTAREHVDRYLDFAPRVSENQIYFRIDEQVYAGSVLTGDASLLGSLSVIDASTSSDGVVSLFDRDLLSLNISQEESILFQSRSGSFKQFNPNPRQANLSSEARTVHKSHSKTFIQSRSQLWSIHHDDLQLTLIPSVNADVFSVIDSNSTHLLLEGRESSNVTIYLVDIRVDDVTVIARKPDRVIGELRLQGENVYYIVDQEPDLSAFPSLSGRGSGVYRVNALPYSNVVFQSGYARLIDTKSLNSGLYLFYCDNSVRLSVVRILDGQADERAAETFSYSDAQCGDFWILESNDSASYILLKGSLGMRFIKINLQSGLFMTLRGWSDGIIRYFDEKEIAFNGNGFTFIVRERNSEREELGVKLIYFDRDREVVRESIYYSSIDSLVPGRRLETHLRHSKQLNSFIAIRRRNSEGLPFIQDNIEAKNPFQLFVLDTSSMQLKTFKDHAGNTINFESFIGEGLRGLYFLIWNYGSSIEPFVLENKPKALGE